jgi:hypothetical protein
VGQVDEQRGDRHADHDDRDREVERREVEQHDRRHHTRPGRVRREHRDLGRLAERASRRQDVDRAAARLGSEHLNVRHHPRLRPHERVDRGGVERERGEVECEHERKPAADIGHDIAGGRPAQSVHHEPERDDADHQHRHVEHVARQVAISGR